MARSADESGVRSVRIALDVLEAVAFSGEEMGVTQIAERLKLTKGSVHRHLLTLVERGYLTQNQTTSRYAIGAKGRLLARLAPEADLARLAEGPMRELRDQCGHSVVLSSMSPRGALVMLTIAGTSAIEIGVRPGSELPYYASAQGKVMLAFAPRPVQVRALAGARPRLTPHTTTDIAAIEEDLARVVRRGYCSAPEEAMLGINAVAAPIFDDAEACVASVAMVGSIQFLPANPSAAVLKSLKTCAQEISRQLGYSGRTQLASETAESRAPRPAPRTAKKRIAR
jgi:DNA-binding IclR family transcriptional regulator